MNHRTEPFSDGAGVEYMPVAAAADHSDYYELFRSFNSERAFLEFARRLRAGEAHRSRSEAKLTFAG